MRAFARARASLQEEGTKGKISIQFLREILSLSREGGGVDSLNLFSFALHPLKAVAPGERAAFVRSDLFYLSRIELRKEDESLAPHRPTISPGGRRCCSGPSLCRFSSVGEGEKPLLGGLACLSKRAAVQAGAGFPVHQSSAPICSVGG